MGLNLLAFDYRGYGESGGAPSEAGLYRDAEAAYRYLRRELGVPADRIILFGHSLGSAVAIDLASRVPPAGLIVEGAFTSATDRGQELYPYIPVRWIAASRFNSIGKMPLVTAPKLFLHAVHDEVIPLAHGRRLFEAASPPKRFVELGGGHAGCVRGGLGHLLREHRVVPGEPATPTPSRRVTISRLVPGVLSHAWSSSAPPHRAAVPGMGPPAGSTTTTRPWEPASEPVPAPSAPPCTRRGGAASGTGLSPEG